MSWSGLAHGIRNHLQTVLIDSGEITGSKVVLTEDGRPPNVISPEVTIGVHGISVSDNTPRNAYGWTKEHSIIDITVSMKMSHIMRDRKGQFAIDEMGRGLNTLAYKVSRAISGRIDVLTAVNDYLTANYPDEPHYSTGEPLRLLDGSHGIERGADWWGRSTEYSKAPGFLKNSPFQAEHNPKGDTKMGYSFGMTFGEAIRYLTVVES